MEKFAFIFIGIAVIASAFVMTTGYFVEEEFSETREVFFDYDVPYVWKVLVDFENIQKGRSDVKSVETIGMYYNLYVWKEILNSGGFRKYKQTYKETNKELILELTESSYGVTGTWSFSLRPENHGTIVTIKESSINKSIIRRGLLFYFDRGIETTVWYKYLRVRLYQNLLVTP